MPLVIAYFNQGSKGNRGWFGVEEVYGDISNLYFNAYSWILTFFMSAEVLRVSSTLKSP